MDSVDYRETGGMEGPEFHRRLPATERAAQLSREVLRADVRTLQAGQPLPDLPAPPQPVARSTEVWNPSCLTRLLCFVVVWAGCFLVTRTWVTGDAGWSIKSAPSYVMAAMLAFFGAVFGCLALMAVAGYFLGHRAHNNADRSATEQLRHDFWQERESLRAQLAAGTLTRDQAIAMLTGATDAPPTIALLMPSPRDE